MPLYEVNSRTCYNHNRTMYNSSGVILAAMEALGLALKGLLIRMHVYLA